MLLHPSEGHITFIITEGKVIINVIFPEHGCYNEFISYWGRGLLRMRTQCTCGVPMNGGSLLCVSSFLLTCFVANMTGKQSRKCLTSFSLFFR